MQRANLNALSFKDALAFPLARICRCASSKQNQRPTAPNVNELGDTLQRYNGNVYRVEVRGSLPTTLLTGCRVLFTLISDDFYETLSSCPGLIARHHPRQGRILSNYGLEHVSRDRSNDLHMHGAFQTKTISLCHNSLFWFGYLYRRVISPGITEGVFRLVRTCGRAGVV